MRNVKRVTALVFVASVSVSADEPAYHWPLDTRPALTSTFGEYRNGRFHAGIDLKTWRQEGFAVQAIADGEVVRLRTSPWGYGRVITQSLPDGRIALYAHLSGFAPRFAALVEEEQDRTGHYSVDLSPRPGQLAVARGEVIGYSGSSGVGMPHLHLEMRDPEDRPINALENGFAFADSIPPTILKLALIPLTPSSTVDRSYDPVLFEPIGLDSGTVFPRRPVLSGSIGVAVDVFDRADASASENRLAPYRLSMLVDGEPVFEVTYSGFRYADNHQADLDRNFALGKRGVGRLHNLYREVGNRLPLYGTHREGDGILHTPGQPDSTGVRLRHGTHRLAVVAEDISGNLSQASGEVLADDPPVVRGARAGLLEGGVVVRAEVSDADGDTVLVRVEGSEDGGRNWRELSRRSVAGRGEVSDTLLGNATHLLRVRARDGYGEETFQTCTPAAPGRPDPDGVVCTVAFRPRFGLIDLMAARPLDTPPEVQAAWPDGGTADLRVRQTDLLAWEAILPFVPDRAGKIALTVSGRPAGLISVQPVSPKGGWVRSPDGMAEATFGANRLYGPLFGHVDTVQVGGGTELAPEGPAYRFGPDDVPFDGKALLSLGYPPGVDRPERLALYRRLAGGRWLFVDNRLDRSTGRISAEVSSFSTFALLRDETPPVIADVVPSDGTTCLDLRPWISATVRDNGAGIWREEDLSIRLDGRRLIVEYDPDRETIRAQPRRPLKTGRHRIEVVVRDICGNEARATGTFNLRPVRGKP